MITLAIETSCDETAICLLETRGKGTDAKDTGATEYRILANLIHSQVELHKQYGGVFPIMAKREHAKNIMPLLEAALAQAKIKLSPAEIAEKVNENKIDEKISEITKILREKESDLLAQLLASPLISQKPAAAPVAGQTRTIDRIAVTRGPGLEPALWVGVNLARALGILWDIPVVGVNHMEGHILGSLLPASEIWDGLDGSASDFKRLLPVAYPALALLISGGHTELVLVKKEKNGKNEENEENKENKYEIVGRTKDDAVGEAFDKTARMLGLPYPGGPEISRLAEIERNENSGKNTPGKPENAITLPRPMIHSHDLNFSFSGLKTAVLYLTRELLKKSGASGGIDTDNGALAELTDTQKKEIAREFEDAVTDVLVAKTEKAIETYAVETLIAGGGVIANNHISAELKKLAEKHSLPIYFPPAGVSGDNALMIALAGALTSELSLSSASSPSSPSPLQANGNLSL